MALRNYGMSPNQEAAVLRTMEEQLALVDQIPTPSPPRTVEDYIPLLKKLRDEKGMSWPLIQRWMFDNTEFNRGASFWAQLYKGKKVGIMSVETPTAAGDQTPKL